MKKFNNILIPLLLIFSSIAYSQNIDEIKTKIAEINAKISQCMLENKQMDVLNLYSDNCYSMPSYSPMVKGKEEMKKNIEIESSMPMKWLEFKLETVDVMVSGNYAIEIGKYLMSMEIPSMPEPWKDNGKYITVFEIQDDGSLLIAVDTWNTDNNPWMEMQKLMQPPSEDKK